MEEERRNTTYEDEKFPGLVGIDEDEDEQRTSSTQVTLNLLLLILSDSLFFFSNLFSL